MKTDRKLIDAAKNLLDRSGENAVTLRAIAQAFGLSHNAPYKHFADRRAILEAVAIDDFNRLTENFAAVRQSRAEIQNPKSEIAKRRPRHNRFAGASQRT